MKTVSTLISGSDEELLSFGDFSQSEKKKYTDFDYRGDLYYVKTCQEITKLEKNGLFEYESVPGTSVFGYDSGVDYKAFEVTGQGNTQIVLAVEDGAEYTPYINGELADETDVDISGKFCLNVILDPEVPVLIELEKR